jgi:hypothetical protein
MTWPRSAGSRSRRSGVRRRARALMRHHEGMPFRPAAGGPSRWSLWSQDSFLSIGSRGSVLSIGSVGSTLSVGSVGSFASLFSVGSAFSVLSLLSARSCAAVMSYRSARALMSAPQPAGTRSPAHVVTQPKACPGLGS